MRSRPFIIVVAVLCGVLAITCIPLGMRFWRVFQYRQSYKNAVDAYNAGRFEEALSSIDKCIAQSPEKLEPYRLAAYTCFRLATPDRARARRYYEAILRLSKGQEATEAHLYLGALSLDAGDGKPDLEQAIAHLRAALEADPNLTEARAALGIAYALQGKADQARPELQRAWAEAALRGAAQLTSTARLWEVADLLRRGDYVEAWNAYGALAAIDSEAMDDGYQAALSLALAFRATDPSISSAVRQLCVIAATTVPKQEATRHGMVLATLLGAAQERLGETANALVHYRRACELSPKSAMTRRNLAHSLVDAAAAEKDAEKRRPLEEEAAKLYRLLLADGQLTAGEQEQVTLALASIAWNQGKSEEAEKLVRAAGKVESPVVERMQIAAAIHNGDYTALLRHIDRALKLDKDQPDVLALLNRLRAEPEIRNFRINQLGPYDARPILSAGILPKAIPVPIPADKVVMKLDDKPVQAIVTQAECFFRPAEDLAPGEHKAELSITDTLGLTASKTLAFSVAEDKEPPAIIGIAPDDGSEAPDAKPIISFRCADPSGIDPRSLSVVFTGRIGRPPRYQEVTVISNGHYLIDIPQSQIRKNDPVRYGAAGFQFSNPLGKGECTVRVGVSDVRGNRAVRKWSFKVTDVGAGPAPGEPQPH